MGLQAPVRVMTDALTSQLSQPQSLPQGKWEEGVPWEAASRRHASPPLVWLLLSGSAAGPLAPGPTLQPQSSHCSKWHLLSKGAAPKYMALTSGHVTALSNRHSVYPPFGRGRSAQLCKPGCPSTLGPRVWFP